MKKFIALLISIAGISAAQAQIKFGQKVNQMVPGAKLQIDGDSSTTTPATLIINSNGNLGFGTANPVNRLDVNGAFATYQDTTDVLVGGTSVTMPKALMFSVVRLEGRPTGPFAIIGPGRAADGVAYPALGTRLCLVNNTIFTGTMNGYAVPGKAATEFIYTNVNGTGNWVGIGQTMGANNYSMKAYQQAAAAPVDAVVDSNAVNDTIVVGLSQKITIPAGKSALIMVDYNVPAGSIGFASATTLPKSSIGIRFLKNGREEEQGSRRFTLPPHDDADSASHMVSIAGNFTEEIPATAGERTITYTLNGFIQQKSTTRVRYRFNMFQALGSNRNWGKANMRTLVYLY